MATWNPLLWRVFLYFLFDFAYGKILFKHKVDHYLGFHFKEVPDRKDFLELEFINMLDQPLQAVVVSAEVLGHFTPGDMLEYFAE